MTELRQALRESAAFPRGVVNVEDLRAEGARRRQRSRRLMAATSVVLVAAVMTGVLAARGEKPKNSVTTISPPGLPSTTASTTPPTTASSTAPSDPLDRVDVGWTLLLDHATLQLVEPSGSTHLVTAFTSTPETEVLIDWSGDHKRALFSPQDRSSVTEVELSTGARRRVDVAGEVRYTKPTGHGLLVQNDTALQRTDLNGAVQVDYPTRFDALGDVSGSYLASEDGTLLVLPARTGFAVVGNDGHLIRTIDLSPFEQCQPRSWWSKDEVLANCDFSRQLVRVPLSGATASPVSAPVPSEGDGHIFGLSDARRVQGDVYVQQLGACGSAFLGKLEADGTSSTLTIPGYTWTDTVHLLGTDGTRLLLFVVVDDSFDCGGRQDLVWYDPKTDTVTPVVTHTDGTEVELVEPTP